MKDDWSKIWELSHFSNLMLRRPSAAAKREDLKHCDTHFRFSYLRRAVLQKPLLRDLEPPFLVFFHGEQGVAHLERPAGHHFLHRQTAARTPSVPEVVGDLMMGWMGGKWGYNGARRHLWLRTCIMYWFMQIDELVTLHYDTKNDINHTNNISSKSNFTVLLNANLVKYACRPF